jgi:two-component system alkaline phosphatase synthesis response regulator PhoP
MAAKHILVVEDDKDILELIRYNLTRDGYTVTCNTSGEDGLKSAKMNPPDLVLLDLMLPGVDGLVVCQALKNDARTQSIPIVMLTAKSAESDIVAGLEIGADDYITKPFSPKVLIARLRAVLRRKMEPIAGEDAAVKVHDMSIDPGRHEVIADGKHITLTHTEFKLLHVLSRRLGWVFTRDQLVNSIRGEDAIITDRTVDVHVASLRKKLGSCAKYIETIRGVGYRLKD